MKRLLVFLVFASLYGCMTIAQIPRQYVYVDDSCRAELPDYTDIVIVYDNCGGVELFQTPVPGTIISDEITVTITARDIVGNKASIEFPVSILDTIPPTIQLDTTWSGYTDKEVADMYRTFYGWVQLNKDSFANQFKWDTAQYSALIFDSTKVSENIVFQNTITFPDTLRRDWWWAEPTKQPELVILTANNTGPYNNDAYSTLDSPMDWRAQTFKLDTTAVITSLKIHTWKQGSPGTLIATIRNADGVFPTGEPLSYGELDSEVLTTEPQWHKIDIIDFGPLPDRTYVLTVWCDSLDEVNQVYWTNFNDDLYPQGRAVHSNDGGENWIYGAEFRDKAFELWGYKN